MGVMEDQAALEKEVDRLRARIDDLERDQKVASFPGNLDMKQVSYTSNNSLGVEDFIEHTLGRVPTGFIVISQDGSGSFYKGTTPWTSSRISLKCSAASVKATLLLF